METDINKLNFRADLLRESLRRNGLSQSKIAELLNLTPRAVSMKMNGYSNWTLHEIQKLQDLLADTDIAVIFKLKKV